MPNRRAITCAQVWMLSHEASVHHRLTWTSILTARVQAESRGIVGRWVPWEILRTSILKKEAVVVFLSTETHEVDFAMRMFTSKIRRNLMQARL